MNSRPSPSQSFLLPDSDTFNNHKNNKQGNGPQRCFLCKKLAHEQLVPYDEIGSNRWKSLCQVINSESTLGCLAKFKHYFRGQKFCSDCFGEIGQIFDQYDGFKFFRTRLAVLRTCVINKLQEHHSDNLVEVGDADFGIVANQNQADLNGADPAIETSDEEPVEWNIDGDESDDKDDGIVANQNQADLNGADPAIETSDEEPVEWNIDGDESDDKDDGIVANQNQADLNGADPAIETSDEEPVEWNIDGDESDDKDDGIVANQNQSDLSGADPAIETSDEESVEWNNDRDEIDDDDDEIKFLAAVPAKPDLGLRTPKVEVNAGIRGAEPIFKTMNQTENIGQSRQRLNDGPAMKNTSGKTRRGFVCQPPKIPIEVVNCPECSATFNFPGLLRSHIMVEHKNLPSHTLFSCEYCNEIFKVRNAYYLHLQEKHPGMKLPHDMGCPCGQFFTRPENLNTHILNYHSYELANGNQEYALSRFSAPEICRYKCIICHSRFIRISSIVKHFKSVHPKEWGSLSMDHKFKVENFLCSVCDMLFPLDGEEFSHHFKVSHPEFNFTRRDKASDKKRVDMPLPERKLKQSRLENLPQQSNSAYRAVGNIEHNGTTTNINLNNNGKPTSAQPNLGNQSSSSTKPTYISVTEYTPEGNPTVRLVPVVFKFSKN